MNKPTHMNQHLKLQYYRSTNISTEWKEIRAQAPHIVIYC
jgi:hypothetical protein